MRYKKEQILRWVKRYKAGKPIKTPEGVGRDHFMGQIRRWARLYEQHGEAAVLKVKTRRRVEHSGEERMAAVARVLAGESITAVAISLGMASSASVTRWAKTYREKGMGALESKPKGRKPSMPKKKSNVSRKKLTKSEREELILARERLKYLEAENAYLKKLDALVTERELGQAKAKGPRPSTSSGKKGSA